VRAGALVGRARTRVPGFGGRAKFGEGAFDGGTPDASVLQSQQDSVVHSLDRLIGPANISICQVTFL
jgi:hypothetical protein